VENRKKRNVTGGMRTLCPLTNRLGTNGRKDAQSGKRPGVRPSSGAATPERLSALDLSPAMRLSYDAAPKDGRTPGGPQKPSQPSEHTGIATGEFSRSPPHEFRRFRGV